MRTLMFGSLLAVAFFVAAPTAQKNLTGSWAVSFATPQGNMDATATFKQEGEALSGTISGPQGELGFTGTVKGKTFTFNLEVQSANGPLSIKIEGEYEGDSIKGTFDFGQGPGDWSGTRNK